MTGWAACRLHGAAYLDGLDDDGVTELPVPLLLGGRNVRTSDGVRLLRHSVAANEIITVAGIRCTRPERAVYDAMWLTGDLRAAVRVLDMACAGEITSLSRCRDYVNGRARSSPLVRVALARGSERSRSPRETDLRLIWELDAQLPTPLVNWPIRDRAGRLIGIPDLFDPDAGLAVEYDGQHHRDRRTHASDVEREARFRDAGCEMVRVVGRQLGEPSTPRRLLAARDRAQAAAVRHWVLGDPGPELDERLQTREVLASLHEHWAQTPLPH